MDWATYATKFTKGIMAMANKRDGGVIIVGWDATSGKHGINSAHLATYDIDLIQPDVNRYAEPYVEIATQVFEHVGLTYLAIGVEEFRESPVVCKKDSPDRVLRKSAVYVRSFRSIETTEVQTPEDMRELLYLATAKGIQRFVRQAQAAGIDLARAAVATDAAAFDAQLARTFA